MWIIPSRSRPHNIKRLATAFRETSFSTPVLLRLDDDDPHLGGYTCPDGWELVVGPRKPLSDCYNEVFDRNLDWYGLFADDVVPKTPGWDILLIEAAGSDGVAFGNDGIGVKPTHFVVGGQLAREIGWIALPGLDRIYIDTVWNDIATERNVLRFLPDVQIPHLHFSNRMGKMDKTYRKWNKTRDKSIYEAWTIAYHNRKG